MALSQSTLVIFAVLAVMAVVIQAVPIDNAAEGSDATEREGRYFGYPVGGVGGSSANAFAASNSFGGGGFGASNAMASASSGSSGIGFPYGK
ncbi:hypothetical protein Ocin01_19644 [Orchesella cincta]|uniref:Uncharacterized protein n=1 Tax=Orchesella cincta TaxID=48709 RepID=A0A1D2M240_ORCCI|nr:hypothetical protein Ocin01_19644 [Orchesella cincta]